MPQAADFDFSTPLQHPYQAPGATYRPPAPPPPPPAAPQSVQRKALSKPVKAIIIGAVLIVVYWVAIYISYMIFKSTVVAEAVALVESGDVLWYYSQAATAEDVYAIANKYAVRGFISFAAVQIGVAFLIAAIAGMKGKLR